MKKTTKTLQIAVPNKGRLQEPTLNIIRSIGLEFESGDRKLSTMVSNFEDIEIVYISAAAIPEYVQNGVVDLGITGIDLIEERNVKVEILERLGFGKASLVVAAPEGDGIEKLADLNGKKIATTFPFLAKKFLKKNKIKAEVVEVDGAVEITPKLGIVDAIVDLSSSGTTLKANKLILLATILDSEAVLIGKKDANKDNETLKKLLIRLESVLTARRKRYIMMNAPAKILPQIKKIAPGLSAPTIMSLSEPGMIAVHSVIDATDVWRTINRLKKIGATGILIVPIERMID
jgi:ATP phosphoribosyltransferase